MNIEEIIQKVEEENLASQAKEKSQEKEYFENTVEAAIQDATLIEKIKDLSILREIKKRLSEREIRKNKALAQEIVNKTNLYYNDKTKALTAAYNAFINELNLYLKSYNEIYNYLSNAQSQCAELTNFDGRQYIDNLKVDPSMAEIFRNNIRQFEFNFNELIKRGY